MTSTHSLSVPKRKVNPDALGFFRFGHLGNGILLTNDCGHWQHVDEPTFRTLLAGELDATHPAYAGLAEKGFVRSALDLDSLAESMRARKRFVGIGPRRHVISLSDAHGRLSVETAKDVIDHVMLSTSREIDFHLVAGDAPVDGDLLKFIVQYATEKNRYEGKALSYRLSVDVTALTDEVAGWLIDKRFTVHTTLRGAPEADTAAAIRRLHALAAGKGRGDWRVHADLVLASHQLTNPAGLVEALRAHGLRDVRLRPILSGEGAVSPEAFRAFYQGVVEALIATSKAGEPVREGMTLTMLTRMLRTEASADVELRSPSAQGTGQLVYDTAGRLFPSEAGRALHAEDEDEMFLIGTAGVTSYKDNVTHPTVRALALASLTEGLPGFHHHWSAPFLGLDPVGAYTSTGDLFTKLPTSAAVGVQLAMLETLFSVFVSDDAERISVLESWLD